MANNQWRIEVRSYEIFDPLISEPAVHNEIVFIGPEGLVETINGHGISKPYLVQQDFKAAAGIRHDGNFLDSPAGPPELTTLRAISSHEEYFSENKPIKTTLLFEGEFLEWFDKLQRGREAGAFINSQNLNYIAVNPFGLSPGQNSNSVAYTIATAMGLEYPIELKNLWAPGHGRLLLPEGFESFFDRNPITAENICEFGPPASNANGLYAEITNGFYKLLDPSIVTAIIKLDIERDTNKKPGARFFDPQNPIPYNPELRVSIINSANAIEELNNEERHGRPRCPASHQQIEGLVGIRVTP